MNNTELRSEEDKAREDRKSWIRGFIRFLGCAGLVILILFAMCAAPYFHIKRAECEDRAKSTLRSIGRAQMAHRSAYNTQNYASFSELQNEGYIDAEFSLDNLTDNYYLTLEVSEDLDDLNDIGRFTAIAYPRDTRPGYLSTCAISEDQIVRVYKPDWSVKWEDIKTWDRSMW